MKTHTEIIEEQIKELLKDYKKENDISFIIKSDYENPEINIIIFE